MQLIRTARAIVLAAVLVLSCNDNDDSSCLSGVTAPGSREAFSTVYSFQAQEHGDGAAPYGATLNGMKVYGGASARPGNGRVFAISLLD